MKCHCPETKRLSPERDWIKLDKEWMSKTKLYCRSCGAEWNPKKLDRDYPFSDKCEPKGIRPTSEEGHQIEFFRILKANEDKYPELKWIHAIPNGGNRNQRTASIMKHGGVKAGVWDVFVPGCRHTKYGDKGGLYIEFKMDKNVLTDEQLEFMRDNGVEYEFCISYDWREAVTGIKEYLGIKLVIPPYGG